MHRLSLLSLYSLTTTLMSARGLSTVAPNRTTSEWISSNLQAALPGLLDHTKLTPLKFEYSQVEQQHKVIEDTSSTISLRQVAQSQSNEHGSLCFVVRRPGCVLCREHAQQLVQAHHTMLGNLPLWAIVKETGVDDVGLVEFHDQYFSFPTYKDVDLSVYQAFGNRRIGLSTWNPIRLYRGFKEMGKRLKEKGIDGNLKGEGMIQGGLLLFDKDGK
jgi:hypothetical protein